MSQQHTPFTAELTAAPTAWQSLPKLVRIAVWLWAFATVLSLAAGVVVGGFMALVLLLSL